MIKTKHALLIFLAFFQTIFSFNFPDTALDPVRNLGPRTFYPDSVNDRLYYLPFDSGMTYTVINPAFNRPSSGHKGYAVDWNLPQGTRVIAARAGNVSFYKDAATSDAQIMISRTDKDSTLFNYTSDLYIHITIDTSLLKLGRRVERGQIIGRVGIQSHVHLEIQVSGHIGIGKDGRTTEDVPYAIREVTNRRDGIPWSGDRCTSQNKFRPANIEAEQTKSAILSNSIKSWPSPCITSANIDLNLTNMSNGKLVMQDIRGRSIKTIFEGSFKKGLNRFSFTKTEQLSGVYFVRLISDKGISLCSPVIIQ
ncbi:MAG: M23 family metallopeptidase [Fibrobacteres bacterium]|nr:M23 family metallopeptidase [Fibrobacterota bacterium]